MQNATDQARRPAAIELAELRLTAQESDAVRRGLTIALTSQRREGAGPRAKAR